MHDATGADNGPKEFSSQDARRVTEVLLGFVLTAEKLTQSCLDATPPPHSLAHAMWTPSATRMHVMDAFLLMQFANLASFDHVRAFVTLARAPRISAIALATSTRGALEALARSFYLLQARDATDLTQRRISLLYQDLRYPARFGELMKTRGGTPIDALEQRKEYLDELTRMGLPAPAPIEIGRTVAELLDSAFKDGYGKQKYSNLSAVAHGHRAGINEFVIADNTGGIVRLIAPHDVVIELTFQLVATMSDTMDTLVGLFGDQTKHKERLEVATSRSFQALERLIAESE